MKLEVAVGITSFYSVRIMTFPVFINKLKINQSISLCSQLCSNNIKMNINKTIKHSDGLPEKQNAHSELVAQISTKISK